jgi:hypothetical protein
MKKLLSAISIAFLLTMGMVVLSEAPAAAHCPYPACIDTRTDADTAKEIPAGAPAVIRVKVKAPGNVSPKGSVTVTVVSHGRVVFTSTQPFTGDTLTFVTQPLFKGHYKVTADFTPAANTVFNASSDKSGFNVKKKFHHHRR